VAAAITVVLCTGYVVGLMDGRETIEPSPNTVTMTSTQGGRPISPFPAGVPDARRVVPNPHVGQGHHPTFDCSGLDTAVESKPDGALSIGELAENRHVHDGQSVMVRARVVQAFPKIMGVNWFHVCDEPNGQVLVASATQWVPPGHIVIVRGTLSLDRNIAGAYHFPLFIEGAQLEGPAVEGGPSPTHGGVLDL